MTRTPGRCARSTGAVLVHQLRTVAADLPLMIAAPLYRRRHLRWGATPGEMLSRMPGDDWFRTRSSSARGRSRGRSRSTPRQWRCGPGWSRWVAVAPAGTATTCSTTSAVPAPARSFPSCSTSRSGSGCRWRLHRRRRRLRCGSTASRCRGGLLWRKPDSTWCWTLTELDDGRTRLVTRVRRLRLDEAGDGPTRRRADGVRRLRDDATDAARDQGKGRGHTWRPARLNPPLAIPRAAVGCLGIRESGQRCGGGVVSASRSVCRAAVRTGRSATRSGSAMMVTVRVPA